MNPENKQKLNPFLNKLSTLLFYFCLFVFIVALAFPHNPAGNWYQQFMPFPSGGQIKDIYFVDSLLGFAVTDSSILKTTNSGDNWSVKHSGFYIFQRIQFLNSNTGFACGGNNKLLKTTNSGENWTITTPASIYPNDMFVLSEDTIWLASVSNPTGGIFRTTNGGVNWENQLSLGSSNPNHIYFYNGRLGFTARDNIYLRRTTDGGASWNVVPGTGGFLDMHFADSLTGWKTSFQKTTDGGLTWVNQVLPSGGYILSNLITSFSNINKDTIWANGGFVLFPNNQARSILNRTTNGGQNWLFQIPDTSKISNIVYYYMNFVNKNNGWATDNNPVRGGIHTTNGGDTTFYLGIQQISNNIPKDFELKQNYPNPFNPRTVIPYKLKNAAFVKLVAYEITGRETQVMVNQHQQAGEYEVDFMGKFSASGVYFYRMEVTDERSKQLYTETKKMLLIK